MSTNLKCDCSTDNEIVEVEKIMEEKCLKI